MHITGSARDLLARIAHLRDRSSAMQRQDTLVFGASLVRSDLERGMNARMMEIESSILSQLRMRRPHALIFVLEDESERSENALLTMTRGIIRSAAFHSHRQIQRVLPAVGIAARPEERALVARRVAHFTQRSVEVGSGVAIRSSVLARMGLHKALMLTATNTAHPSFSG
ncbi:hypothetical protein [Microbacterium sp. 179-I 3D4 NHS]|uniref:hypothetical protein n=1 Tax=Microbacterium sp. 179-I 3D4 NHS TaxID=3142381 RepID=UPI0039A0103F